MEDNKKKSKKIRNIIISVIFLIIILAIVILLISIMYKNNKKVLIESYSMNFAWGFYYDGTIICEDGTIYEFECDTLPEVKDIEEYSKVLINSTTKKCGKIPKEDLAKLKEMLSGITYQTEEVGIEIEVYDAPTSTLEFYDYNSNQKILLKQEEANIDKKINVSNNINDILEIIDEYTGSSWSESRYKKFK